MCLDNVIVNRGCTSGYHALGSFSKTKGDVTNKISYCNKDECNGSALNESAHSVMTSSVGHVITLLITIITGHML